MHPTKFITLLLLGLLSLSPLLLAAPAPTPNHGGPHSDIVDTIRVSTDQIICTPDERASPLHYVVDHGLVGLYNFAHTNVNAVCSTRGGKTVNCFRFRGRPQPWYDFRLVFGFDAPVHRGLLNYRAYVKELQTIRDACETSYPQSDGTVRKVISGFKLGRIWVDYNNPTNDRYAWFVIRGLAEPGYSIENGYGFEVGKTGYLKFVKPIYVYRAKTDGGVRATGDMDLSSNVTENRTSPHRIFNRTDTVDFEIPQNGRMMTAEEWKFVMQQDQEVSYFPSDEEVTAADDVDI